MKTKNIGFLFILFLVGMPAIAQDFSDNFENESVNDVPTHWKAVKGSCFVGELDDKKILKLDRYTVAKPVIDGKENNYLSDQFTIEFDAFYSEVPTPTRQYYIIHLWDGTGIYGENGQHADPYMIYRHGIRASGSFGNNTKIPSLAVLEKTWRHIKIEFAQKTLKIFIDEHLVHNQPNLFYDPPMVSFSARNASGDSNGITNISITGLVEGGEQATEVNPTGGSTAQQNLPYSFPEYDGEANQILQTDGNGTLSWVDYLSGNSVGSGSTGLEAINEGNGIGWRLIGRNPDGYDDIGHDAIDLSVFIDNGSFTVNTYGATGQNSLTTGVLTKASGRASAAFGFYTDASGIASTSFGNTTQASGNFATVYGEGSIASGDYSTAYGYYSTASGYNSTAIGNARAEAFQAVAVGKNNIGGGNPDNWVETDPLFEIGNSNTSYLSNALTVFKNGTITAPSFDISEITDPKALVTKEYLEANVLTVAGLEPVDEGNGIGWRLAGVNKDYYGKIGANAIDLSSDWKKNGGISDFGATGEYSFAVGSENSASGSFSFVSGWETKASGQFSSAFGQNTIASGTYAIAFGKETTASSTSSSAFGFRTIASGAYSTAFGGATITSGVTSAAFGAYTKAESYRSFVLGAYNLGGGNPQEWRGLDPLFEIGNGADKENPNNALTVLKNGNIGIGTHTPQVKLHIQDGTDANNSTGGYLIIGDKKKENIVFDNNEIIARNNVQPAILYLQSEGGDVYVGRAIVHSSDKRLKKNIEKLSYGLDEILQLRPVAYHWKSNPIARNKSLGLIAQEVQPILKELITVNTNNDTNTLGVNYTELIPILINAIQEQQAIIDTQGAKIKGLTAEIEKKDKASEAFDTRLKQIETRLETYN